MEILTLTEYLESTRQSKAEFAAKSGLSEQSIYKYCNGERMPRWPAIKKMKAASKGKITLLSFDKIETPKRKHPRAIRKPEAGVNTI